MPTACLRNDYVDNRCDDRAYYEEDTEFDTLCASLAGVPDSFTGPSPLRAVTEPLDHRRGVRHLLEGFCEARKQSMPLLPAWVHDKIGRKAQWASAGVEEVFLVPTLLSSGLAWDGTRLEVPYLVEDAEGHWVPNLEQGAPVQTVEAPDVDAQGLVIQKRIRRLDGSEADLENLVQGDRLIVDLVVAPREERLIPAIVEDLLPPGFEIEAVVRPEDAGNTGVYSWLDNIRTPRVAEARDDRFVAALDLRNRRAERIAYVVRAVTPGSYTLPGAVVEDMYRPDTFARSATGRIVIAPRG